MRERVWMRTKDELGGEGDERENGEDGGIEERTEDAQGRGEGGKGEKKQFDAAHFSSTNILLSVSK